MIFGTTVRNKRHGAEDSSGQDLKKNQFGSGLLYGRLHEVA